MLYIVVSALCVVYSSVGAVYSVGAVLYIVVSALCCI